MKKEKNKSRNRPNGHNWRNTERDTNRNKNHNTLKNNGKGFVAGRGGVSTFRNRNERKNTMNSNRFEATRPIGYKTLVDTLKVENDAKLILKLSSSQNGFLLRLDQQSIESGFMCLILEALARISQSSTESDMIQLLVHFYMNIIRKLDNNSNFYRELKLFITDLSSNFVECSNLHSEKYLEAIQNLLVFLRRLQLTLYQKSFHIVRDLMHLITVQINFINKNGNLLNDFIIEKAKELNESVKNFAQMKKEAEQAEKLMVPQRDYRKMPIYPDAFDISNHEPFIRANIVEGKYVAGVEQYLDIQFRLLREDFVRPLRIGITQYRNMRNNPKEMAAAKFRVNDLNIYRNVQIHGSKMFHSDQIHLCKFDCTPFRNIRWQYNKRMMSGSLVCLSQDDFETFFFATVAGQREPEKLATGEFQIKLEIESSTMPKITPFITYVMVESPVYFESYRHNLKVLQAFGMDNFPLEKYIVDVNKNISPPSYLSADTVYEIPNGLPDDDPDAKMLQIKMMSNEQWPTHDDFNLDESQCEAFRAALTKQMVVIQGPPGTGKTYIGLRIIEVLLKNTSQWPILIVCHTNHALDQFLEGILKLCDADELVRIGGKSQNEALDKYNLSRIKSGMNSNRNVPSYIHNTRSESNFQLRRIQRDITELEISFENITNTVLGQELEEVIERLNMAHSAQLFELGNERSLNEGILNWLGYDMAMENNRQENNENNIDEEGGNVMEQELREEEMDEEYIRELERQRYINESSDESADESTDDVNNNNHRRTIRKPISYKGEEANRSMLWRSKRNSLEQRMKQEIKNPETMALERAEAVQNINTLSLNDRWCLYRLWIKLYVQDFERKINYRRDEYRTECLRFDGLRKQEDIEIVKTAKIIGMTTTGAAKYRHIIDGTKPKITIVEEAAEVLEAHIVTALSKHTDHLILIGDHLQLRPNPAVYELAKKFKLEISLFERLIKNEMEYHQLKQQHRMRPCISSLLVPHIYKQLLDHPSVEKYEDVKGISKNMFFINHRKSEMSMQETRSHLNTHEAEFIVALSRYVVLQGYETSQVTILTAYSGQLNQIRELIRKDKHLLNGVRATVVDNYQGEECDIILLSFVRSNEEGNIGFVKDSHRINVALSRARKGLYGIGNFDCLAEKSPIWQNLMSNLRAKEAIGDALELYCQNHTDYKSLVNSKDSFDAAPQGGCSRSCGFRLPCGHACPAVCHIIDRNHMDQYATCHKYCNNIICDRGHQCRKKCHYGEDCGKCEVMVEKIRSDCHHKVSVTCSGDPLSLSCFNPCKRTRDCGHKCKGHCGQLCDSIKCYEKVQAESPCGHRVTVNCVDKKINSKLVDACSKTCGIELKCGHLCKGSCGQCANGRLHISCEKKCSRTLICGHSCPDTCSVECKPCNKPCANRCVHSKCSFSCGEPCPPCNEKCGWHCKHLKCSKLCSEPCDRELCKYPNRRLLKKCKHLSIGVCGEKMPKLCRICNKDKVEEIFFGNEDEPDARFIELDDCGHTIEVNGLIGWMKSEPESDQSNPNTNSSIQFKKCPKCKTVIRRTISLNTFIQASLRDIEQVKIKTCGNLKENKATQRSLFEKVRNVLNNGSFKNDRLRLKPIYEEIFKKMESKRGDIFAKPKQTLVKLNNQFQLIERLRKIFKAFYDSQNTRVEDFARRKLRLSIDSPDSSDEETYKNICSEALEMFNDRLRKAASFIRQYNNCEQQRADIEKEWTLLQLMCDVIVNASRQQFNETGKKMLNDAFELANKFGCATDSVRNGFQENVRLAWEHSSGIGITLKEKEMVLKAMNFKRGHWYKCPNGHVYSIGECGGPNQTSKCPDCGTAIGGQQHRLVDGNAVATEMDGARNPAWPQ